jgi:hypothetical protein
MHMRRRSNPPSRPGGGQRGFGPRSIGLLLLGAGALAGCAPAAAAAPRPDVAAQQAPVHDGDCAALFPDALVSEVLGTTVTAQGRFVDSPIQHAVPTLGGLGCEWAAPIGTDGSANTPSLSAVVLSSTLAATEPTDVTCSAGAVTATSDDALACRFGVVADDLWLSGVAYAPAGTPEDDIRSMAAELSDAFRGLPAGPVEPGPLLPDTAWVAPDCAELSSAADMAEVLDSPDLVGYDVATSGDGAAEGLRAAQVAAGAFACAWIHAGPTPAGQRDGFSVLGLPGGAWAQTEVLAIPGASVVDIPGVGLAVRVPTAVGHDMVDVFDGVNWVQIMAAGSLEPVLPALPALLDALAVDTGAARR